MVQLRGDLTKKMEDGAGKVRFRRWKNMTIGARISLVILIAIIVVAALADFIYDKWAIINFVKEFQNKKQYLNGNDYKKLEELVTVSNR